MKVAVLGESLKQPVTGIGHYARNLIAALARQFPKNEYVLVRPGSPLYSSWEGPTLEIPLREDRFRRYRAAYWDMAKVHRAIRGFGFDIIHDPGNVKAFALHRSTRAKQTLTIHDLSPLVVPATHKPMRYVEFQFLARATLRHCDGIMTDTVASMRDIEAHYPRTLSMTRAVVHLGVGRQFFEARRTSAIVEDPYFLCVGSIEPRKNLATVLRAFSRYCQAGGRSSLRIVGPAGWKNSRFYDELARSPFKERVKFTGYVPDDSMPALYSGSSALLFPSLHEGFGLPLVEAMAAGCPIITSDVSCMPEVVQDAAITQAPLDDALMAENMRRIEDDETLRRSLVGAGARRAEHFRWERVAAESQAFFDKVIAK